MKKAIYILTPLAAIFILCLLPACKKTNEFPSKVVAISYPVVTLVGPADTTISRGAAWKDPGATWVDSLTGETGVATAVTLSGSINTNIDSAYFLVYVATNKNGFQSINNPNNLVPVTRGLAVTNINSNADISGAYTVFSPLGAFFPVTLTKVSRGLFFASDIDGFLDPGVIAIKSDSTISVATVYPIYVGPQPPNNYFETYVSSATIPETFTQASVIYQAPFIYTGQPPHQTPQPPVIISFNETPLNGTPFAVQITHN